MDVGGAAESAEETGATPAASPYRKGKPGKKGMKGSGKKGFGKKGAGKKGAAKGKGQAVPRWQRGERGGIHHRRPNGRSDESRASRSPEAAAARGAARADGREDPPPRVDRDRSPATANRRSSPARPPAMRRPVVRLRPPSLDGSRRVTFEPARLRSPERGPTPPRRGRSPESSRRGQSQRSSGQAEDRRDRGEAREGRGGVPECEQQ